MKVKLLVSMALSAMLFLGLNPAAAADLTAGMKTVKLELKSAGPLASVPKESSSLPIRWRRPCMPWRRAIPPLLRRKRS